MKIRKLLLVVPAASLLFFVTATLLLATEVNWHYFFYDIFESGGYPVFNESEHNTEWGLSITGALSLIIGGVSFWQADKNLAKEDWYRIGHALAILIAAIIVAVSLHWKTD